MKPLARRVVALGISHLPGNLLRLALYRSVLGYQIDRGTRVGWRTVICVDLAILRCCILGRNNRFIDPFTLEIGTGVGIGSRNDVTCGDWTATSQFAAVGYERLCRLGAKALITDQQVVDVGGGFEVGGGSWLAGRGSQFWTHDAGARERSIRIGARCYIGEATRFAPGSAVGDDSIVSLGSVVTRRFPDGFCMIAGVPVSTVKTGYDWKEALGDGDEHAKA